MKKFHLWVISIALSSSLLLSSCIGSFALTSGIYNWNRELTNSKFVNEVVFLAMFVVPVYEVAVFVDAVVLNSVEFWKGENPVYAERTHQVTTPNGKFTVKSHQCGYTIVKEGEETPLELVFDEQEQTWNVRIDGTHHPLVRMQADDSVDIYMHGTYRPFSPDAQGFTAARTWANYAVMVAYE